MNEAPDFVLFLGRFHPLVVHLPIGFLFFAFLLEVYSKWKKTPMLLSAIPLALLSGAITAAIACILGYMLSMSGDYDEDALDIHFWFGIATTVVALLAWLIRIGKIKLQSLKSVKANISTLTLIVILLSITGHYGGNLTHGSDYLTKYLPFGKEETVELVPVTKIEEAQVFSYLVNPILQDKCTSCHNADKKKGGLSLQDSISILKGGKNGTVLIAGDSKKSELTHRVLLDPYHDDFMPPDGKTPLTEEETAIVRYWIDNANADFGITLGATETPENIMTIAANVLDLAPAKKGSSKLPTAPKIDTAILENIISEGFAVRELVFESNLYQVTLLPETIKSNNASALDGKFEKLNKIKDHIVWFYAENNQLTDTHLQTIGTFTNLQKLVINKNKITDTGISAIANLEHLNSINVYSTDITKASLHIFSKMKNLNTAYVWNTNISRDDITAFKDNDNMPELIFGM